MLRLETLKLRPAECLPPLEEHRRLLTEFVLPLVNRQLRLAHFDLLLTERQLPHAAFLLPLAKRELGLEEREQGRALQLSRLAKCKSKAGAGGHWCDS